MSSTLSPAPPAASPSQPPPRPRRRVGAATAAVVFALALTGTAYLVNARSTDVVAYEEFPFSDAEAVSTPPEQAAGPVGIALADAATQDTIDRLESVSATASPGQLSLLARLLLQRAAVTGDADTYARAITALDSAVAQAPGNIAARSLRAAARVTMHDFEGAEQDAERVLATDPDDSGALGASYDAAFETGDYALAERRLTRLVQLGPQSPQVLFRAARWETLHGNTTEAASLTARARAAAIEAGAVGTARATYDLLAGKEALDEGRYSIAIGAYESALEAAPGWHSALAGLGRARAAAGDLVGAEEALSQAADLVPLPDTFSALGDVRTLLGDTAGAQVAYGTVDVVAQLEASQQRFSRAIVLSRSDRGVDTAAAVADARAELRMRHDVYGYDALAWALLADGRPKAAVRFADQALALGTLDPKLFAHAGLAHAAVGDNAGARRLLTQAVGLSANVDPLLMQRVKDTLAAIPTAVTS